MPCRLDRFYISKVEEKRTPEYDKSTKKMGILANDPAEFTDTHRDTYRSV